MPEKKYPSSNEGSGIITNKIMLSKNFYYKEDVLLCDGIKIENIVQKYSTPVFIYSELHKRKPKSNQQSYKWKTDNGLLCCESKSGIEHSKTSWGGKPWF